MQPICHFCTIVTASHLPFAKALLHSLQQQCQLGFTVQLSVLIVDAEEPSQLAIEGMDILSLSNLNYAPYGQEIIQQYASTHADKLRWCLKPVLLHYLINRFQCSVIYADSDLYFFNHYHFLFELLNQHAVLLSPHFRSLHPQNIETEFLKNFTEGMYNGGFIGASEKGLSALEWWAQACSYACEQNAVKGLFDDQKYLDLLPARFSGVHVLQHKGCNVAAWNINDCKRVLVDEKVLIDGVYLIIFIHFAYGTCTEIMFGSDKLLDPYLKEYVSILNHHQIKGDFMGDMSKKYTIALRSAEPRRLKIRRWLSSLKKQLLHK